MVSCRLEKREIDFLKEYSQETNESRGEILRQLLVEGRKMEAVKAYKQKSASLGKAAGIAGISISEMMDLLSEFCTHSNLTLQDYKESRLTLKKA